MSVRFVRRSICVSALLIAATSVVVPAQTSRSVTVRITTAGGAPVPYAVVSVDGALDRIADDSGRVWVTLKSRDSVQVSVRRIGFRPFDGWAHRNASGDAFVASITPLAAIIDTVRVTARQSTPLSRTGFYDRVERVRKGAQLGEFITPEELDRRNPTLLSHIFQGRQYSRISNTNFGGRQQAVLLGRARCAMNIVVDGIAVTNTIQEIVKTDIPQSIRPEMSARTNEVDAGRGGGLGTRIGLDDIVDGRAVMGIEIYPSTANAPVELIPTASRGSCGLVAIWTGPRK